MTNLYKCCAFALFISLFTVQVAYAQRPQGQPGGQGGGERQMPDIGRVVGKVLDAASGEPVEYATVALMRVKDSALVTGGTTDARGRFDVSSIKLGVYFIKINFIGYDEYVHGPVKLLPQGGDGVEIDLGVVKLKPSVTEMDEVEVVGERDMMEMGIDKKIFSVAKNISAEGGSATDVLKNIPSINVDIDGNVSLRGSENVTVLIDGRPSGLSGSSRQAILEQLPAGTIDRIEVITNPSSRYDADGMAGIINIITKKNAMEGMNGSVTASIGTRNKYNGGLQLNYRVKKWNFYTNYNYRYEDRFMNGFNYRETQLVDSTSIIDQSSDGGMLMQSHVGKIGFDYSPNSKNTLSFGILGNGSVRDRSELNNYRILGANLFPSELRKRQTVSGDDGAGLDINLDYVKTFAKPQKELMIGARQSYNKGDGISLFDEKFFSGNGDPLDYYATQRNNTNSYNRVTTIQADFVNPIDSVSRMEMGYKSIIRDIDDDFFSESFNLETEVFNPDIALINRFRYQEQVHSLYGIYGRTLGKKWSAQVGLRAEQTFVDATLVTTGDNFTNNYFSLFPNAYLNYIPAKDHELRLSYSRRIDRPNTRNINPFVDVSDPLNIRKGNPFLFPEFVDSYDLSYSRYWKSSTFSSSIYWRQRHDIISRINTVDGNGVSTITFVNLLSGSSYGIELIGNVKPTKWWDMNLSANFFRNTIDGSNINSDLTNEANSYSLKLISTWTLPKFPQIQLSTNYRSPFASAQGTINAFYSTDIALSHKVLEGKGTLSFRVSDIFNTLQFGFNSAGVNFVQESARKRETRIAYLTFMYRFGKMERQGAQRRQRQRGPGEEGGMDMD